MKCKEGVVLKDLQLVMRVALKEADIIWKDHGQELWITSTADGVHSAGSLHPYGYAVDFRHRYFEELGEKVSVTEKLAIALGSDFQVLNESSHIHCEYQKILDG